MFWLISLSYGVAVLAVVTALVCAIIWSVEKFQLKDRRHQHWRLPRLIKWLRPRGTAD
jgi:hypothetical protein